MADIVVIGAGPAGLAAAIAASEKGRKVTVLDRNQWLGGILPQCIHDGFGVLEKGVSLTGPEYAGQYIKKARERGVDIRSSTMVLELEAGKGKNRVRAIGPGGIMELRPRAIILATGCRERTRWAAMIPGTRPSGIYTAGVAQAMINLYNRAVGRKVVILGSGNVGLIMARRMTLEGAEVKGVVEIMPYATGLPRNVVQCLEDYNIPLHLSHTITNIKGRSRLTGITMAKVDKDMKPIQRTEMDVECDTLLLSLGLVPENELAKALGVEMDPLTGGPRVDQDMETSIDGVYACGNCLHVHDTVDMLTEEAALAGRSASSITIHRPEGARLIPGRNVSYVVPQWVHGPGKVIVSLRAKRPMESGAVLSIAGERKRLACAVPSTMIREEIEVTNDMLEGDMEADLIA